MLRQCTVLLLLIGLASTASNGSLSLPASSVAKWELPLRTRGANIFDALSRPVRLACVNWYGAHLEQMVMNGLNEQPLSSIADKVVNMGLNCVRLPFSLDMVFSNATTVPYPNQSLAANPELRHKSPLEIFDATVISLTAVGLLVILNNHVSSAGWCCSTDDGEGLWYTKDYDEAAWLDGLEILAARYKDNPLVVGFDLRNEIRISNLGNPTWGGGDPKTDWAIAARKGSNRVMSVNDNMLLIISGLRFGAFLCDVPNSPLHLEPDFKGRMVYTAHEYPWTSYHLMVRGWIISYVLSLVVWCGILSLVTCFALRYYSKRNPASTAPTDRNLYARLTQAPSRCEFIAALLSTGASLVCVVLWYAFWHRCGFDALITDMVASFFAFAFGLPSLILWMRLALAFARQVYLARWNGNVAPWSPQALLVESQVSMQQIQICDETAAVDAADAGLSVYQRSAREHVSLQRDIAADANPQTWIMNRASRTLTFTAALLSCKCFALAALFTEIGVLLWVVYSFGTYQMYVDEVDERWGFLTSGGDGNVESAHVAPVWIGEFGTNTDNLWWRHAIRYMGERNADFAYWPLNGQRDIWNHQESYGLLREDTSTIRYPWVIDALQRLASHIAIEV